MTIALNSTGVGNLDAEELALDLVRDRLAGLGREYSPVDVATAMRAEGLVVSDSAVLDTVESLRRHSVGAGPLEPLLRHFGNAADRGLRVPRDLRGFAPPAVRADGRTVTLAYAGPGARGFLLVQAPGDRLTPPLDDDPLGARVRGHDGRWSPGRGELEWVEDHRVLTLRSNTLPLEELLTIGASLEPR